MPLLEFAPRSPFHNIEGTVANLKAQFPGITPHGINQAVKMMLAGSPHRRVGHMAWAQERPGYKPRTKGRIVTLYGADIMTADLETLPAWPWIGPAERGRLAMHPITCGVTLPDDMDGTERRAAQERMAKQYPPGQINRSVLISPPGLQQTYVWRLANGWIQEVTDHDYHLILSTPANRLKFSNPELNGPYVPVRSYDAPGQIIGATRKGGNPLQDIAYIRRHMASTPHWQGTDLGDE